MSIARIKAGVHWDLRFGTVVRLRRISDGIVSSPILRFISNGVVPSPIRHVHPVFSLPQLTQLMMTHIPAGEPTTYRVRLPADARCIYRRWYRLFAPFYDLFTRAFFLVFNGGFGGERRWREQVVGWVDPRPGEKILDMCSGAGTLTLLVGRRLHGMGEVVGIEMSPDQLRIASKKPAPDGVRFLEADVQRVPFPGCLLP
jgi:hypothetical protein